MINLCTAAATAGKETRKSNNNYNNGKQIKAKQIKRNVS